MKLWEILKEENMGKKYTCTLNNKQYEVTKITNNDIALSEKDNAIISHFYSDEIMKLEFEENKSLNGWGRAKDGNRYYYTDMQSNTDWRCERNSPTDCMMYKNCNYFSTKEKAKEVEREQLLYRQMKKFYDENDGKVNYKDNGFKSYIYYNRINDCFGVNTVLFNLDLHTIYFSTEELALECLEKVVYPFIKKYGWRF